MKISEIFNTITYLVTSCINYVKSIAQYKYFELLEDLTKPIEKNNIDTDTDNDND